MIISTYVIVFILRNSLPTYLFYWTFWILFSPILDILEIYGWRKGGDLDWIFSYFLCVTMRRYEKKNLRKYLTPLDFA